MSSTLVARWNQDYQDLEKLLIDFFQSNNLDQLGQLDIIHEKMDKQLEKLIRMHGVIHRLVAANRPGKNFPWMTTILDSLSGVIGSGVSFLGEDKEINRWLTVSFFTLPFIYTLYKDWEHNREMKKVKNFFEFLTFISKEQYTLKELQKWNEMIKQMQLNHQTSTRASLPSKDFLFQRLPGNVRKKIDPSLKLSRAITSPIDFQKIEAELPSDWESWSAQRIFNTWYQNLQATYAAFGAIGAICENKMVVNPVQLDEMISRIEQLLEALKINYKHAEHSLSLLSLKYGMRCLRLTISPTLAMYIVFLIDFIATFLGISLVAFNKDIYAGISLGLIGIFSREIKGHIQLKRRALQIEDRALLEVIIHRGQDLLPHFKKSKDVMSSFLQFINSEHRADTVTQHFLTLYNRIYDIGIPVKTCLSRTDLAKILINKISSQFSGFNARFQDQLRRICNIVGYLGIDNSDNSKKQNFSKNSQLSIDTDQVIMNNEGGSDHSDQDLTRREVIDSGDVIISWADTEDLQRNSEETSRISSRFDESSEDLDRIQVEE